MGNELENEFYARGTALISPENVLKIKRLARGWYFIFGLAMLIATAVGQAAGPPIPDPAVNDGRHDFDFLIGSWKIANHRLRPGGGGQWDDFQAKTIDRAFLGDLGNMDEMDFPNKKRGISLRFFDPEKRQWSIYWASTSTHGLALPPVVGKFRDGVGLFYSDDTDEGKSIKVRYTWSGIERDAAHWELAYSYDDGKTWVIKWTMVFARAV